MEDECNYFSYDSAKGYCVLFHYFDLLFCTSVSGTAESEISNCTPEAGSHTCDDFVDIECSYPGEVLVTQPNFLYPVECQNVLVTLGKRDISCAASLAILANIYLPLGNAIGAEYFHFDGETLTCSLLAPGNPSCSTFSGPDEPDMDDECGFEITTPGTPGTDVTTQSTTPITTDKTTTVGPTDGPTSAAPTDSPTDAPTGGSTDSPTDAPTGGTTDDSSDVPTDAPTDFPTGDTTPGSPFSTSTASPQGKTFSKVFALK